MVCPATELLWLSLDLDGEHKQIPLKKLTEICVQKLINGSVFSVSKLHKLPSKIHTLILSSAIAENKIFAVENLMRLCPYETIEVHAPSTLKSLHTLPERNSKEALNVYEDFMRLAARMLSVFFDLIKNKNKRFSQLRCLDFGAVPVTCEVYNQIRPFFLSMSEVPPMHLPYTLKFSAVASGSTDIYKLIFCLSLAEVLGFKLIISGIFFYNNFYPDVTIINLLENLGVQDMELVGCNFSTLLPSIGPFWSILCKFKHIKYLNLSYVPNALNSETCVRAFASALNEFSFLERLVLKGLSLTGLLSRLFQEFCKKDQKKGSTSKCCIIHNGTLEYLDISNCRLAGRDVEILRELALKNSLKYVNISDNSLAVQSTCETLLTLKSSLTVLEMNHCFHGRVEYDAGAFPLGEFKELKYLSMKGWNLTQNCLKSLTCELFKLKKLEITIT